MKEFMLLYVMITLDIFFVECSSLQQVNTIANRLHAQLSNIDMQVTPLVVSDAIRYMVALKKYIRKDLFI